MEASNKLRMVRETMKVFPEYDLGDSYKDSLGLNEIAIATIRGIVTLGDAPPPAPPVVTSDEFIKAMSHKKIAAIKEFRNRTNLNLKESKDAIEAIMGIFAEAAVEAREPMPF